MRHIVAHNIIRTFTETYCEILLALLQDTTIILLAKIGKF